MSITTISSRKFNQDAGGARKAAERGPVVITDRGRPAHVLLNYADYEKLLGQEPSLAEALAMPGGGNIDFQPPRLTSPLARLADLDTPTPRRLRELLKRLKSDERDLIASLHRGAVLRSRLRRIPTLPTRHRDPWVLHRLRYCQCHPLIHL